MKTVRPPRVEHDPLHRIGADALHLPCPEDLDVEGGGRDGVAAAQVEVVAGVVHRLSGPG
ncbi:hypothetical protein ACU4GR_19520 [Methylobacterium oryzae CBMB20]